MFYFGLFFGVWSLIANVSEHCLLHIHRLWRWNRQSVPKRWQLNSIHRRTTQKSYNIQNTAKVWNQELLVYIFAVYFCRREFHNLLNTKIGFKNINDYSITLIKSLWRTSCFVAIVSIETFYYLIMSFKIKLYIIAFVVIYVTAMLTECNQTCKLIKYKSLCICASLRK
jgi:hypothetical protein